VPGGAGGAGGGVGLGGGGGVEASVARRARTFVGGFLAVGPAARFVALVRVDARLAAGVAFLAAGVGFVLAGVGFVFAGVGFVFAGGGFVFAGVGFVFAGGGFPVAADARLAAGGGVAAPALRAGLDVAAFPVGFAGTTTAGASGAAARLSLRRCGRVEGSEPITPGGRSSLIAP
jgi:hypothetical protein